MDRFIVRDSRSVYPSGDSQIPQFPQRPSQNAPVSYIFEGNFSRESPNHYQGSVINPYMMHHSPSFPPSGIHGNLQHQHVVSGIDPSYLSGYANNTTFIAPGEHINNNISPYVNHGYQNHNRNNLGTERNFTQQKPEDPRQGFINKNISNANQNTIPNNNTYIYSNQKITTIDSQQVEQHKAWGAKDNSARPMVPAEPKKTLPKDDTEKITINNNFMSRADKLKLQHQHVVSGIDPSYLSGYANNTTFIAPGEHINNNISPYVNHGYQNHNRNNLGTERNFTQQKPEDPRQGFINKNISNANQNTIPNNNTYIYSNQKITTIDSQQVEQHKAWGAKDNSARPMVPAEPKKTLPKDDTEKITINNNFMSRADKLKAVQKNGSRTFSGQIEKVLKWHKALQEFGLLVFYEIVAKCVSVRQGDSCMKHLVIRDDNGPAMQVVYYEVDFLLPEFKTPCIVRVIGKMMAGTSRFQAFNVRSASGDDVAMLPRRAAVSTHHVAKICKEFQCVE